MANLQVGVAGNGTVTVGAGASVHSPTNNTLTLGTNGDERVRIDSSGKILAGATSSRTVAGGDAKVQVEATSSEGVSITRTSADNGAAYLSFGKTRSGSVCQAGDKIGAISWNPDDGTDLNHAAAEIQTVVASGIGGNDVPGDLVFSTNGGATSTTERLRIDSSGNLLAGTTSASALSNMGSNTGGMILDNIASSNTSLLVTHDTSELFVTADASYGYIWQESNHALKFGTNTTERMQITAGGDVLFNCTSLPSTSVAGAGFEKNGSQAILFSSSGSTTSSSNHAEFLNSNGVVGTINTNGSATAYNTSSDYRLKENQVAISDGITRLKTLKPYRFNFKADPTKTVDGFFAHEVTAVPEAISGEKDGTRMQGIDQSKLVPLLTAALQEAITKIETLETKVAALESA